MGHPRAGGSGDVQPARRRRKQFRPLFLRQEELDRLFQALQEGPADRRERDLALAHVLCLQVLRSNEARMLDLSDVHFVEQELHVRFAKGGKERTVPLFAEVAEAIVAWLAVRLPKNPENPALFISKRGTRLSNRQIRKDAKRWARVAGLPPAFHPHTGRHSGIVRLRKQGKRLEAVRDFAGHSSIAVTDLYSHLSSEDLRREILGP